MMEKRSLIILAGLLAAVIAVAFTVFAPMDKNIKLLIVFLRNFNILMVWKAVSWI